MPGLAGSSRDVLLGLLERDGTSRAGAREKLDAMSDDEIRTLLYDQSPAELLGLFAGAGALGGMYFAPFVLRDGHVVLEGDPIEAFARGEQNAVPVILGTNRDEQKLFLAFASPHLARLGPVPLWFKDERLYDLNAEYGATLWKASGVDEPAEALRSSQGGDVWGYRFDWDEEGRALWVDLGRTIGAGHAIELLFVFGGTNSDFAERWILEDPASAEELSRQMRSYWAQFAATGDPGRGQDGSLPEWGAWGADPGDAKYLVFDSERDAGLSMSDETWTRQAVIERVASDDRLRSAEERCEIYRGFVQWSDAMTPDEYAAIGGGECEAFPLTGRTPIE